MKKIILTLGLVIAATVFTSYIEPTKTDVKLDKNSSSMDIKGAMDNSGTR
jgi:hypothetical protein